MRFLNVFPKEVTSSVLLRYSDCTYNFEIFVLGSVVETKFLWGFMELLQSDIKKQLVYSNNLITILKKIVFDCVILLLNKNSDCLFYILVYTRIYVMLENYGTLMCG